MNNLLGDWSWVVTGMLVGLMLGLLVWNRQRHGRWSLWGDR